MLGDEPGDDEHLDEYVLKNYESVSPVGEVRLIMSNPIVRNVTPVLERNKNNKHILTLSGTIANLSFLDDTISAKAVKDSLDNVKEDIVIRLNSGGDVFEGIEIYNYLKSLSNHITLKSLH